MKSIEHQIERIIALSEIPEDPAHSRNTKEWLLKLKPSADTAFQIAALGHDIERSVKEKKVHREDYTDYNEFKRMHSLNSARILGELLSKNHFDKDIIDKVTYLVECHEFGGSADADTLKDADSIAFFDANLPLYYQRSSRDETVFRIRWGFERLSENVREIVTDFRYDIGELDVLFQKTVSDEHYEPVFLSPNDGSHQTLTANTTKA